MMGILNVTPDSFSDGGQYNYPQNFLKQGHSFLQSGVKVLDIGAQSTAPKSRPICAEEEKTRLTPFFDPLLELARDYFFIVSLDTYRPETAHFFFAELLERGLQRPILWNSVAGVL